MRFYPLVLISLISIHSSYATNTQSLDNQLQHIINHYLTNEGKKEGVTGIAATISYPNHQGIMNKTFVTGVIGYPPYNKEPVTKNNLFEIGSITKSFTSVMILQLQAEGLLKIDDKIGKWLPQYPNWKDVTIKQLLNMTSGIPSYSRNKEFQNLIYKNIRAELTDEQLLKYANPDKPVTPGKTFDYSNTNYILAGLIIEAITHHSFADELQSRILDPFKLKNTYYVAGLNWKRTREKVMPRMVHGYYYDDESKKMIDVTDSNLSWGGPAGALISDTQEVATWVQVLYHGLAIPELHREKALKELESVVSETGQPIDTVSKENPRGFGLGVGYLYDKDLGRFWVYEGSGMGYRTMYLWKACNNVSVVAALNNKAGEANSKLHGGDHIQKLLLTIYKKVIDTYPTFRCHD